jgi:lipopolysaccharide transport system permease protein
MIRLLYRRNWGAQNRNICESVTDTMESELPIRVITAEPAVKNPIKLFREMLRDINAGRELAWRLFVRDLKAQYRQSYFGYLWALAPPLIASTSFIFLQSQGITKIQGTFIPYPAFALIGTMLWQIFVDALMNPITSVNAARPMLGKLNFPREALLISGIYMIAFNVAIRLALLFAVMITWGVTPDVTVLVFPLALIGLVALGFAVGLAVLPIGLLYGDISRGLPMLLQFAMFLTPVVYPIRTSGLAGWLTTLNPVAPLVSTARDALTGQPLGHLVGMALALAIGIVGTFLGFALYRIIMPRVIERMGG